MSRNRYEIKLKKSSVRIPTHTHTHTNKKKKKNWKRNKKKHWLLIQGESDCICKRMIFIRQRKRCLSIVRHRAVLHLLLSNPKTRRNQNPISLWTTLTAFNSKYQRKRELTCTCRHWVWFSKSKHWVCLQNCRTRISHYKGGRD